MKPDSNTPQPSPRELLEERVIALLLGELSDNDAAEIKALMSADASLKAFHDEMLETIDVVGDAHRVADVKQEDVPGAALKLNDERRAALMEVIGEEEEEAGIESVASGEKIARPWFSASIMKIAAALIVLCVPLGALFLSTNTRPKMGMLSSESAPASDMGMYEMRTGEAFGEDAENDEATIIDDGMDGSALREAIRAESDFVSPPATTAPQSFTVQLQTEANREAPAVRLAGRSAQQQLFLPGQGQNETKTRYFRSLPAGEAVGASDAFVSALRGGSRLGQEVRLAEQAESSSRRGQILDEGQVAGMAGRKLSVETEPVVVDAISSFGVAGRKTESRRRGEMGASGAAPADVPLDAFGAPIGGLAADTMNRGQMDAAFEEATKGTALAAIGGQQESAAGIAKSGYIVPPTQTDSEKFVAGRASGLQSREKSKQVEWSMQSGNAAALADKEAQVALGQMFEAPMGVTTGAGSSVPVKRELAQLSAPELPAVTRELEADRKVAAIQAADSGALEKAKRRLSRGAIVVSSGSAPAPGPALMPPPAPSEPPAERPVLLAGAAFLSDKTVDFEDTSPEPAAIPLYAGATRSRARDLGVAPQSETTTRETAKKSRDLSVAGVADKFFVTDLNQGVVAGKNVQVMDVGEELLELERLGRKAESEVERFNFSGAEQPAKLEKRLGGVESQMAAKSSGIQAKDAQQAGGAAKGFGGGMGGGGGGAGFGGGGTALERLDGWRRSQEEFRSEERAMVMQRYDGEGKTAQQKAAMWGKAKEDFKKSMDALEQTDAKGKERMEGLTKESLEIAKLSATYNGIYGTKEDVAVGVQRQLDQLDQLNELRGSAEREIEYTKSKLNEAAMQMMTVQKSSNQAEIEKWQREVNAWQSRVNNAQLTLEKVEENTQNALSSYQDEMFDGAGAEMEAGDVVTLFVLEDDTLNGNHAVRKDGTVVVPKVGAVKLEKQDIPNGELAIKKALEQTLLRQATVMVERIPKVGEVLLELEAEKAEDVSKKPEKKQPQSKPNPEIQTKDNAFSTFSLNVSDVSFKLAAASLEKGQLPEPASVRSEEFVNAFNYRDPAPTSGEKLSFAWERAGDPFQHNRDLIRFSIQTAAVGRESGRPLNIVVLLDNSGSMERADRLAIVRRALLTLAEQMTPNDRISIVAFARTPRLWVNGMKGGAPEQLVARVMNLIPQGGTNLEAALDLGYEVAQSHFRADGNNRIILLTDGAANLGDVDPARLKAKTEAQRKKGIALDCFGIGWEGLNDAMLESLTRNADGRYGFLNTEREAREDFADQLAGSLQVAASNVKAQVEFNPRRVLSYRQIGYEKHQLKKEQFRDNTVDAAEIGAAESGTALYSIQVNHQGQGPLGVARIRFLNPGTGLYEELEWPLPYRKDAPSLADAAPSMRLAGTAAAFAEWLAKSPYAGGVTPVELQNLLSGVAENFPNDERPKQLEAMIRQARQTAGATGGP